MTYKTRKLIDISIALALACCICVSMTGFAVSCDDMYENIVRIRIIANSDSSADQELKLRVRDGVLSYSKDLLGTAVTFEDALAAASVNSEALRAEAERIVKENGFGYSVSMRIGQEYFETRVYDTFTLPAGNYETLVFTLGEGKGENWWCVMYPQVCVGACAGELTDSIEEASAEYASNAEKYVLKFKIVEIFQKIKKFL